MLVATALSYWLLDWQQLAGGDDISTTTVTTTTWRQQVLFGVPLDPTSLALLVGIHLFGALAQILDRGFLVAIERDWVVVMSTQAARNNEPNQEKLDLPEPNKDWLSETNVVMRQIDLSAKVLSPAIAGWVIGAFDRQQQQEQQQQQIIDSHPFHQHHHHQHYGNDLTGAALLVGLVNVAALVVEWICTARIYHLVPALAHKAVHDDDDQPPDNNGDDTVTPWLETTLVETENDNNSSNVETSKLVHAVPPKQPRPNGSPKTAVGGCGGCHSELSKGLREYFQQPISLAGLGLALLYVTMRTNQADKIVLPRSNVLLTNATR